MVPLPEALHGALREHLAKVRELFEEDRRLGTSRPPWSTPMSWIVEAVGCGVRWTASGSSPHASPAPILREIELPAGNLLSALFLFNVGIEFGQLAIIGIVVPLGYFAWKRLPLKTISIAVSAVIGAIGFYWFGQRAILWDV
jgi:HupE / UreJ protein